MPQTCLRACKSGFEPRSALHHHYPSVKSLSLPLNNPVGPQAWRGFSLCLADLGPTHPAQILQFPALSRSLFSTSCELAESRVRKTNPLQIKDLAKIWDRQFFRVSLEQTAVRKKREDKRLRILAASGIENGRRVSRAIDETVPGSPHNPF